MKRRYSLLLILVLTMVLAALPAVAQGSGEDDYKVTVTIDGQELQDGEHFDYQEGSTVKVSFRWPAAWTADSLEEYLHASDIAENPFTVDLGDLKVDPNAMDILYDRSKSDPSDPGKPLKIGEWRITEDGKLEIKLEDSYLQNDQIHFSIDMEGVIELDPDPDSQEEDLSVDIGGATFDITAKYKSSTVTIKKEMSAVNLTEDGFTSDTEITVTVGGGAHNVVIEDIMGEYLDLLENPEFEVIYYPEGADWLGGEVLEQDSDFSLSDNDGFSLDFGDRVFGDNDKIVIRYKTKVNSKGLGELFGNPDMGGWGTDNEWSENIADYPLANTAQGTYQDRFGKDAEIPESDYKVGVSAPSVSKEAEFVDEDRLPGLVEWTLTFNSGVLGKLSELTDDEVQALLDELGIEGLFFEDVFDDHNLTQHDYIQEGLEAPGPLTQSGEGKKGFKYDILTAIRKGDPRLTETPHGDGSYDYVFKFQTVIDGQVSAYRNDVSVDITSDHELKDHAIVGIGWDFSKSRTGINEDTGTMGWEIDVEVPEAALPFDWIEIRDTPQGDYNAADNKSNYSHQVLMDTILIDGKPASWYQNNDPGVTVSSSGYGFVIRIAGDSQLAKKYAAKALEAERHFTITFETEAVNGGSRDGSLEGNYEWVNNAEESLKFDGYTQHAQGEDKYFNRETPSFEKACENGYTDSWSSADPFNDVGEQTTLLWSITVNNEVFLKRSPEGDLIGSLFTGLKVELTDTLPDNTVYVAGSAYATLSSYGIAPAVREALTERLVVTDNGDGTLGIEWRSDAGTAETVRALMQNSYLDTGLYLVIYYQTAIENYDQFMDEAQANGGSVMLVNTVRGKVNSVTGKADTARAKIHSSPVLEKVHHYDENYESYLQSSKFAGVKWDDIQKDGRYNVYFEIDINKQKFSLGENGTVTLIDEMGSSLELILDTIKMEKFTTMTSGGFEWEEWVEVPRTNYSVAFDPNSNQLRITVADGTYYRLSYWAVINDLDNTSNSIYISANAQGSRSSSGTIGSIQTVSNSGGSLNTQRTFTVYKYTTDESGAGTVGLPGAQFELVKGRFVDGVFQQEVDEPVNCEGEGGGVQTKYVFDNALEMNYIFRLTETTAPNGYLREAEPRYFYFSEVYTGDTAFPAGVEVRDVPLNGMVYFENKRITEPAVLEGKKTIENWNGDIADVYSFTLRPVTENAPMPQGTVNDAYTVSNRGEAITFPEIRFSQSGIYEYTITEEAIGKNVPDGIVRDATVVKVTVNVTVDQANGANNTHTVTYEDAGGRNTGSFTFTNVYATGGLKITKEVVNSAGDVDTAEAFTFTVTLTGKSGALAGPFPYTVMNADGTEDTGSGGTIGSGGTLALKHGQTAMITGIPVGARYAVSEDENEAYAVDFTGRTGTITDSVASPATASFRNILSAASASFTGTKTVSGDRQWDDLLDDGAYTFTLTALAGAPMPGSAQNGKCEVTNDGTTVKFPAIVYIEAATYRYTITETAVDSDKAPNVAADGKTIYVTVTVTDDGTEMSVDVSYSESSSGTPGSDSFTFNNTYTALGNLTVSKTVRGSEGDPEQEFSFTVDLHDGSVSGPYKDMEFIGGVASFTLKHGESKTAEGLPAGLSYTVTESNNDGYEVQVTGDTGTIPESGTATAAFINTRGKSLGNLSVSKIVQGTAGDTAKPFTFTVTLDDLTVAGTFGDMTFVNGVATFTLKHGETKAAVGLPAGLIYTVAESGNDGYEVQMTGETGTITVDSTAAAIFTNIKDETAPDTGSLTVSKTVTGSGGDKTREFTFTVMLSDISLTGKYGDMTFSRGVAHFTLKHGESKTASGLPAGINYSVSETAANKDGYTIRAVNSSGVIDANKTVTAIFVNAKEATPDVPQTGDDSRLALWIALMLLSLVGMGSILYRVGKR